MTQPFLCCGSKRANDVMKETRVNKTHGAACTGELVKLKGNQMKHLSFVVVILALDEVVIMTTAHLYESVMDCVELCGSLPW